MKYIKLGVSDLKVSAVALGCMRIADLDTAKVENLIAAAMDCGINFFDHADIYGGGRSETVFGEALRRGNLDRSRMILQSKCAIRSGFFDFSKKHILASTDGILSRLGVDYLDVLLLHRPDALMEPEEVAEAFDRLYTSGKVRYFGVSNQNPGQMELLRKYLKQPIVADQLQLSCACTPMLDSGFNVNMTNAASIDHDNSAIEYCRLHDITIQTWSSLQYGFFEGTFLGNDRYAALNAVLARIAEENGTTPAAVAIAWILRHPAHMQAIVGTTKPQRIRELAQAASVDLTREQWYEIYRAAGNTLP